MITLRKAILLLTMYEKRRGLIVLMFVMGMALLETAGIASVMPFLAILGNPQMIETNPILRTLYSIAQELGVGIHTPDNFFVALGIGSFMLIVLSAVYRTITQYVMNRFIEMLRHSIGVRLMETYLHQPYAFFLDRHSGDMSKSILSEVDQLITSVFRPAYNMAAYSIVMIAISTLLILVNPWLALLAAGLIGGLYSLLLFALRHKFTHLGEIRVRANKKRFVASGEVFGGIKDIKLLGREQCYINRFEGPSKQFAATHALHLTLNQVPNFLIEAIIFGAILLLTIVLMITGGGLASGTLGELLPILGLYVFAAYRMKPAVQNIYQGLASLRYRQAIVESLYADLQLPLPLELRPRQGLLALEVRRSIALQHVSYTYPNAEKPTLIDLNLEIPVGSSIGLVGSTGAGKTTLVDILLGLLRPTKGVVSVDGTPVTDECLHAWQQSLGYVPQETFLTDTSIAENIALGIPREQIDYQKVVRCACMAQVHDFIIQELPAQFDTLVGERGVRLSGGQRQRVGIARALYHNPEVLVFDEATSALDTVTEQAVMDAITSLAHQKTIILIAHRLSTVESCDQIVLLEQGQVKANGLFEDLVLEDSLFRRMAGVKDGGKRQ